VDEFSRVLRAVAAASIAQVHRARLRATGEEVAVKVLRPGIEKAFQRDIDAFRFAARVLDLVVPSARRLRPLDVIAHFEGVVRGELDLRMESAAASEFADTTAGDDGFRVPAIHWACSGRRVMTLDWVEGIGAADVEAIRAQGHDTAALARRVLQLFLSHALRDGYFHGDMHQGNLKIDAEGRLVALDFGIMGRIDDYTRRVLCRDPLRLHPPRLPPRGRGAFRGGLRSRRPRHRTNSPRPCALSASPSSAWTPRTSPWAGSLPIFSR
jgi:ubiquinone biosynthesis protein